MQTLVDVTKGWYQKEAYTIHTLRHHEERNRRIWQVIRIVLLENKIKEMDHFYTNVWIRYGFYKWCYHFRFEWQQIFPKIVCLVSFWLELNQIFDITIYETKAITFFSSIPDWFFWSYSRMRGGSQKAPPPPWNLLHIS